MPADRAAETAAELGPVFARLAEVQAECARIREQAAHDAELVRERAGERAAALVAEARERAEGERAELAARIRAHADTESARRVAEAGRQAAALRERAERRLPGLVDKVVGAVLALGAEGPVRTATGEEP